MGADIEGPPASGDAAFGTGLEATPLAGAAPAFCPEAARDDAPARITAVATIKMARNFNAPLRSRLNVLLKAFLESVLLTLNQNPVPRCTRDA
jgi:hypothetical protein